MPSAGAGTCGAGRRSVPSDFGAADPAAAGLGTLACLGTAVVATGCLVALAGFGRAWAGALTAPDLLAWLPLAAALRPAVAVRVAGLAAVPFEEAADIDLVALVSDFIAIVIALVAAVMAAAAEVIWTATESTLAAAAEAFAVRAVVALRVKAVRSAAGLAVFLGTDLPLQDQLHNSDSTSHADLHITTSSTQVNVNNRSPSSGR